MPNCRPIFRCLALFGTLFVLGCSVQVSHVPDTTAARVWRDPAELEMPEPTDPAAVHAWIINGDGASHHVNNVRKAADALRRCGVPKSRILVASPGSRPRRSVSRSNHLAPTRNGITLQAARLADRVVDGNTVIIYLTGHGTRPGRRRAKDHAVALRHGGRLASRELLAMIDDLPAQRVILVTDMCFGGGFVETFDDVDAAFTGIASTDGRRSTFCQPFAGRFWERLSGFDGPALRAAFDRAVDGCSTYRTRGSCRHGPDACPTYEARASFRHRGPIDASLASAQLP